MPVRSVQLPDFTECVETCQGEQTRESITIRHR